MKIGELSAKVALSAHTIRYYEKMGLLEKASKDLSGHRYYDEKDVDLINWVTCLKKSGMPLEKIKRYAKAYRENERQTVVELLEQHLNKLLTQQVDITHYIDVTQRKLNNMRH